LEALEDRAVPTASISVAAASMNEFGAASALVAPGSGGLSAPHDLVLGPDGNIYVASRGTPTVVRYNGSTGKLIGTFVPTGSGGVSVSHGLAFGPDGNLYVGSGGDGTNSSVLRFNGTTGAFIDTFVSAGSGGLNRTFGFVFGADGNLYVASGQTNSVMRYRGPLGASPGSPLPSTGQIGANFVPPNSGGLTAPTDLVFGPDGALYVTSTAANEAVLKFDGNDGAFISTLVSPGEGGLVDPRGLAFDQDGRLYVADINSNAVHRYDNTGQYLDDPVAPAASPALRPVGLAFDPQGRLLIAGRDTNSVLRYDRGVSATLSRASATSISVSYATTDGTAMAGADYTGQTGTITFAPGQTSRLILLATHDDTLVESNETFSVQLSNPTGGTTIGTGNATVTIMDDDAARQLTITDATGIEGDDTDHSRGALVADNPGGQFCPLTFGPDGNLYVGVTAGVGPNTIRRYDGTTGAFMDTFVPAGLINGPRDIVFRDGYLYIGNEYTDEVLRFSATTGAFDEAFVTAGSGGIDAPHGLTFGPDANNDGIPELYVTGRNSNTVTRYDGVTGLPVGTFVTAGSGGLTTPEGLTFDPSQTYLYVASSSTNQVLKYNAHTGAYVGVAASAGLATPKDVKFGADGLLCVISASNNRIMRFNASGVYVDDLVPAGSGGMINPYRMAFGPDGDLYVTTLGNDSIFRFGTESEAFFSVAISTSCPVPLTVNFATADGTAHAGANYTAASGTLTFPPGVTTATLAVPILNDGIAHPALTFTVTLSDPIAATLSRSQAVGTVADSNTAARFYVVNDATSTIGGTNTTYKYQASSSPEAPYSLGLDDLDPRGVTSTAAGTTNWIVDANKNVYVYSSAGALLGSWSAGSLSSSAQLTGIATNGADIWLVDSSADMVYKYAGAAGRLSGSQNAASSFNLVSGKNGNSNPQDLVTDGTSFWVVDGTARKVFKYTLSGSSLGSWTIDPANNHPTGLTINPSNVSDIWIVDNGTDKVYQYAAAASRISGSQNAAATFALNPNDINPQGIADPPPAGTALIAGDGLASDSIATAFHPLSEALGSIAGPSVSRSPALLSWLAQTSLGAATLLGEMNEPAAQAPFRMPAQESPSTFSAMQLTSEPGLLSQCAPSSQHRLVDQVFSDPALGSIDMELVGQD
jgi:sugar lactone lactonase YvrE